MLNYLHLIYSLFFYVLKLVLRRIITFFKKIFPKKIKIKIKQLLFSCNIFWKFIIFLNKWVRSSSITQKRLIDNFIFYWVSFFFIPLFIFIIKKEKFKILMLEKLRHDTELKNKFEQFTKEAEKQINDNLCLKLNTQNLTKSEIEIYENLNRTLFFKNFYSI